MIDGNSIQLDALRAHLACLDSGAVGSGTKSETERLLSDAWSEMRGDDGGMAPYKLLDRTEAMDWHPPVLAFEIERHGGTALGSVYATVQHWNVNVDEGRYTVSFEYKRQVHAKAPVVKTKPIAAELAAKILEGLDDPRLQWRRDRRRVRVLRTVVFGTGPKETLEGRSRRLRRDLLPLLVPHGCNLIHGGWWEVPDV